LTFRRQQIVFSFCAFTILAVVVSAQTQQRGQQQPSRDTSVQQPTVATTPPAKGRIAGRVLTADTGRPVARARVLINAAEVPGGRGAQTDDQGAFRVWGLNPGDYYVSAQSRTFNFGGRGGLGFGGRGGAPTSPQPGANPGAAGGFAGGGRGGGGAAAGGRGARGGGPDAGALAGNAPQVVTPPSAPFGGFVAADTDQVTYAPTFYPGVSSVEEARTVTVGLSAEVLDVNFGLLLVRTGRVSGRMTKADGTPSTRGNLSLMPESTVGGRGGFGRTLGARVQWDGSFSIANVPPGRYVIRARGDDTDPPQFATQPVVVADGDV
jgi:hypothetical protein